MRIALADGDAGARASAVKLLTRLGHDPVAAATGHQLVEVCRAARPELVITDMLLPDTTGVEASLAISKFLEAPVILVAPGDSADLLGEEVIDHVMVRLAKPVGERELRAAILLAVSHFGHYLAVRAEAASPKQALEDRKVVERAKAALAGAGGLDEQAAFGRLRLLAVQTGRRLAEVAREVAGGGPGRP